MAKSASTGNASDTPVNTKKLFVLDTNVPLVDPGIIFRLEEHDIRIPTVVFSELDNHKSGLDEINRNARQTVRLLDELTVEHLKRGGNLKDGILLSITGHKEARGRLFLGEETPAKVIFDERNNDNRIIEIAFHHSGRTYPDGTYSLISSAYADVVVFSNDGNVRLKARTNGLTAEGVRGDIEVSDEDVIPSDNIHTCAENFWDTVKDVQENTKDRKHYYTLFGSFQRWRVGDFVSLPASGSKKSFYAQITSRPKGVAVLRVMDRFRDTGAPWGITPKNAGQESALQLLMDPEIDFVTLVGVAGTGKNFLTIAAALHQVIEQKLYDEVIVTRATVPLDRDIGFLPGTEQEKMDPWMGAFHDNIDALTKTSSEDVDGWKRSVTLDLVKSKIKIKSMNFMRGRTFMRKFLVVDEAQNLTQKQAKTMVSRAGPGTKVVFLGNVAQIDTPYLTEHNCGLVQTVHRFRNAPYLGAGYVLLQDGVRSLLADAANSYL